MNHFQGLFIDSNIMFGHGHRQFPSLIDVQKAQSSASLLRAAPCNSFLPAFVTP